MACKCCLELLLKLLNLLLTLAGLAMIGYGIYLFVEYKNSSSLSIGDAVQLGRPMLITLNAISVNLPKAWFIYLFIGVGAIVFIISCFGCIGLATRNGCCLCFYSILILLLILIEIGCAAFIFFDKTWESDIPTDKTGDFDSIYAFMKDNWNIAKWVALGVVILQALVFVLAIVVRAMNRPATYDSDDEVLLPRQQIRQPLIHRQSMPAAGGPVSGGGVDQRASRNDAWSTRMREKYGLDTSEFTYNPSDGGRYQQVNNQPTEERSRCTIM